VVEKIVAIGLLTQRDLDVLGSGFKRVFPVEQDDSFADLIERLDAIGGPDASPPAAAKPER
jgi:hypothetical protein